MLKLLELLNLRFQFIFKLTSLVNVRRDWVLLAFNGTKPLLQVHENTEHFVGEFHALGLEQLVKSYYS